MKRITLLLLVVALLLLFVACSNEPEKPNIDVNELIKVCQLSTIDCKIHNLIKSNEKEQDWWKKIFNSDAAYNYVVEYDASFKIGIDFKEIKSIENEVVTVVISHPYLMSSEVDENSLSQYKILVYNEDGVYLEDKNLSIDSHSAMLEKAQNELKDYVESNKLYFAEAETNGKQLIQNYISQFGLKNEIQYRVEFEYFEEE